ncbi:MAG: hypothetical protein WC817_00800 [Patescibacteria group bacterium]|jgi:hypothetical protein
MRHNTFDRLFFSWVVFATGLTCVSLLAYTIGQQVLRMNANDPQVEIVEEVVEVLKSGVSPENILPNQSVDIANRLAVFVMIVDKQGTSLASTASLDGKTLSVPVGVLAAATQKGENRVTWQPKVGVRSAVVVRPYEGGGKSGYVVAGRSLREVERRAGELSMLALLAWGLSLVAVAAALVVQDFAAKNWRVKQ